MYYLKFILREVNAWSMRCCNTGLDWNCLPSRVFARRAWAVIFCSFLDFCNFFEFKVKYLISLAVKTIRILQLSLN